MSSQSSSEAQGDTKTTYASCYMCTSDCPTTVVSKGDDVVSVSHPECFRATGMVEQRESDKRITQARIRADHTGAWETVDYDDAISHLADKITKIRDEHGPDAVAFFVGYTKEARPYFKRLANTFGSAHYISESSCCFGATVVASELTYGNEYTHFFPGCRIKHPNTKSRLVWGNNTSETNIPYDRYHVFAETEKVPTIVVDPRRTKIAERATIHLQLRPGTDGALALGLAHVILREGLEDSAFLAKYGHGFDAYKAYVQTFTPEHTSAITGIPAILIEQAATLFATTKPAQMVVSQEAMVQQSNGIQNHRAVILLAAITGNLDVNGGNRPFDHRLKSKPVPLPAGVKPPKGTPMGAMPDEHPLFTQYWFEGQAMMLADYIESGRVKAVVSLGANLMMWPNTNRLVKALKTLEVFSVSDFFPSPTTDVATVFLPAATHLERQALIAAFGGRVQYRPASVKPRGQAHGDTEMIFKLAKALGLNAQFWDGDIEASYEERLQPLPLNFSDLAKNGKSVSLDLNQPRERHYEEIGFKTPSGKIEFDCDRLKALGHDGLPTYREPFWSPMGAPGIAKDFPLVLSTGIRTKTFTHSQGRELETLRVQEPIPLAQMHPADAADRGISDGDQIKITSPVGEMHIIISVTDTVLKGVVHVPHGWAVANCNVLIPDGDALDPISGYPPFKASLCQVARA